jgi:hypothetical protein
LIIGEQFAWGHLPKAAGDTTLQMFGIFPELVLHADPADGNDKHALFKARADLLSGKLLMLNIRRLPHWILSYALHVSSRGTYPDYRPSPMMSPQEMAQCRLADEMLERFTDYGRWGIGYWLRTEYLAGDFLHVMRRFADVSDDRATRVREIAAANTLAYDRKLGHWFTLRHIEEMYERNPMWAGLERSVYGHLLALAE